jgi:hypothetical protein
MCLPAMLSVAFVRLRNPLAEVPSCPAAVLIAVAVLGLVT